MNSGVFNLTCRIFEAPLDTVPHWKALRYGIDDSRGLSSGSQFQFSPNHFDLFFFIIDQEHYWNYLEYKCRI